jgi:hypothetical protein
MSIKNQEVSFYLKYQEWFHDKLQDVTQHLVGFRKLGFEVSGHFIIEAFTVPPSERSAGYGNYYHDVAISEPLYRRHKPTGTYYVRASDVELSIANDWGRVYTIRALKILIDLLAAECERFEIPQKAEVSVSVGDLLRESFEAARKTDNVVSVRRAMDPKERGPGIVKLFPEPMVINYEAWLDEHDLLPDAETHLVGKP